MAITNAKLVEQYQEVHKSKKYGKSSEKFYILIREIIREKKKNIILDFGGGQSNLVYMLADYYNVRGEKYEPSIKEFSELNIKKADLILNTDVLEHIPEHMLNDVLEKIKNISTNVYFSIHTGLATVILPNGENAHCTVHQPDWWKKKLKEYFDVVYELYSPRLESCIFVTWEPQKFSLIRYNLCLFRINPTFTKKIVKKYASFLYPLLRSLYRLVFKRRC
jgi:hypothetical protein